MSDAGAAGGDEITDWSVEAPPQGTSVPAHLGSELSPELRHKLHQLLFMSPGQLGSVYRAMVELPGAGPTELLPRTDCANSGAVGNRRAVVNAVINGVEPRARSVASQAASSVRTLMKSSSELDVLDWLGGVLLRLEERAESEDAVIEESKNLEADSSELAETLQAASGVYVYTYPHYWRYPYIPGTERRLLKVGRTSNTAWSRVLSQARQTGMPEDPLLLRVYETDQPSAAERSFHMLLDSAEHERSRGAAVGKEWFSTTLEFCDTIATVLGFRVVAGSSSRDDVQ